MKKIIQNGEVFFVDIDKIFYKIMKGINNNKYKEIPKTIYLKDKERKKEIEIEVNAYIGQTQKYALTIALNK